MNWGPKSFKIFSFWYEHPDFVSFPSNVWNASNVQGKRVLRFKEKLRRLKDNLKRWNREVFGILDLNVEEAIKELNSIYVQVVFGGDCVFKVASDMRGKATCRV